MVDDTLCPQLIDASTAFLQYVHQIIAGMQGWVCWAVNKI